MTCEKCGQPHDPTRCRGHRKTDGGQCRQSPIRGGAVCIRHGGAAGQVRAAANVRVVDTELRKMLGKLTPDTVDDPLTELMNLAGEVVAWKRLLAARVAELQSTGYQGMTGEQIRADVVLFERAMDRCASVLVSIARLNIDDRLVDIAKANGALLAGVVQAILAELELTPAQQQAAPAIAGKHLRAISAGVA